MSEEWKEAHVTISGHALTVGESMTLRVALSMPDCDCGDDEHGTAMTKAYGDAKSKILGYMVRSTEPAEEHDMSFNTLMNFSRELSGAIVEAIAYEDLAKAAQAVAPQLREIYRQLPPDARRCDFWTHLAHIIGWEEDTPLAHVSEITGLYEDLE